MSDETEYDFGDDVSLDVDQKNVGGNKQEWLKFGQKGQVVRGAFVYFHTYDANAVQAAQKEAGRKFSREEQLNVAKAALAKRAEALGKSVEQLTPVERLDTGSAHFKTMKAHYDEGLGYVISRLGMDGPEADQVWKRLPDPKTYISTLMLIYPTNQEGMINKEVFANQVKTGTLRLLPWRFGPGVYEDIWTLNDGLRENNLSLASQDIKLECKEPKYQNIAVSFGGASIWQKNETIRAAVLNAALPLYEKLIPFRRLTTDQLREKLGVKGPAGGMDDVTSDNFGDLLDNV